MMRSFQVILCLLACSACVSAQDSEAPESPSIRYHSHATRIILQAVGPELGQHGDHVNIGTVKFLFQLDPEGHLHNLKVASSTCNRFVEETCLRLIQAAKFPPVPSEVFAEQPGSRLDMEVHIELGK